MEDGADKYANIATVYDQVYLQRGKDYQAEADLVADLVISRNPRATALLDVACGTGLHLEPLARRFFDVEGLELSAEMREAAEQRLENTIIHSGDMRNFELDRKFDAVTCLFSSIGHMANVDELGKTVGTMAKHLRSGGVLVIEPWWFPETFAPGYVGSDISTVDGRTVARVSYSWQYRSASIVTVHFTVADVRGISHFVDEHTITLFDREVYEGAFRMAGLDVDYLSEGPSDRGVFVGVKAY